MPSMSDFLSFMLSQKQLHAANRPLRLRLALPDGASSDMLLPQRVTGTEQVCGGFEYRVLCLATDAALPLKAFIAAPAEIQFVTDRGGMRSVCGIVTEASAGNSDGGVASYQLVVRDAMAIMEMRTNTRIFRNMSELEVLELMLGEWRLSNPVLASAFEFEFDAFLSAGRYPQREFIMQHNESDASFLRRLMKRRGIAWFFRARSAQGGGDVPVHTLVIFDDPNSLQKNAAGMVRFHRDDATEQRDTITAWGSVRTLQPGSVTRHSWDYRNTTAPQFMTASARSRIDQGSNGNQLAASLDDYLVEVPHAGNDHEDHCNLGMLRMARHDYASKCFRGEGSVRDLCVGEYITLTGHPEIDSHPADEREFVITSLRVEATNNLPAAVAEKAERLFDRNRWDFDGARLPSGRGDGETGGSRSRNAFTAVRRGIEIVPAFDPRTDLPVTQLQSVIVVGPQDEEVYCDQQGRVKVRFPGTRVEDHQHASGAGASDSDADSAWVRVASNWAGNGPGSQRQCGTLGLPRVGSEALVAFLGGDPDKPVIVGQLYNEYAAPPALSDTGDLPGNRYLSGIKSREVHGERSNQLRLDDTPGQISAQLASDHARSELNLGWLTKPRADGKAQPRGEGAELRSDEQIALRGAKGILLSAWGRLGNGDKQLARAEYLELMEECVQLFCSLGEYAADHQALPLDLDAQAALQSSIKNWESGSNTEPKGGGASPAIGITAPAGISFATSKAIISYAASNIDTIAQQHLQMTAGQRVNLNAGKGISLFSHHDGIKAIAHHGKFLIQSQHDDTEVNAAKNIKFTAGEGKITGMAKVIELISEDGSFIRIGKDITLGSSSPLKCNAPKFVYGDAETMSTQVPLFDAGAAEQRFVVKFTEGTEGDVAASKSAGVPDQPFEISLSDGTQVKGITDSEGRTELIQREAMHSAVMTVLSKEK
jgi:type VI secretion system secreted protein VgrG